MQSPADMVLGHGDLLDEILLRLDIPTFLILASRVCAEWRRHAMDPVFLRRFRQGLARRPRPLGFYISFADDCVFRTKFVPMPQRQPELADVVNRASFRDHPGPGQYARVLDCRNGRLLLNLREHGAARYAVLSPLGPDTAPVMAVLPRLPPPPVGSGTGRLAFLPVQANRANELSCFVVDLAWQPPDKPGPLVRFSLFLQAEAGFRGIDRTFHAQGLLPPLGALEQELLVGNKLYMFWSDGYIVRLDLASMSFLTIPLPQGVPMAARFIFESEVSAQMITRADDSGSDVYFLQVRAFHLRVWLYKTDASAWVLEEDIFLAPQLFGHHANPYWDTSDEGYDVFHLFGAGDNAEFVFLVDNACERVDHIFYLNIRTRKVELAYNTLDEDGDVLDINPFMMV